jgi:hypothetical protein
MIIENHNVLIGSLQANSLVLDLSLGWKRRRILSHLQAVDMREPISAPAGYQVKFPLLMFCHPLSLIYSRAEIQAGYIALMRLNTDQLPILTSLGRVLILGHVKYSDVANTVTYCQDGLV